MYCQELYCHHQRKKLLRPKNWFWCKKIRRNKKLKNRISWRFYTTGCLLDNDYIKNYYRLIAVDLSRKKELDADPKAIQQIEFVGQLKKIDKNGNVKDAGDGKSTFVLTNLEKIKETRIKFSSRSVTVL